MYRNDSPRLSSSVAQDKAEAAAKAATAAGVVAKKAAHARLEAKVQL